jgi:long-chain acyl-CoA synthetase
MLATLGSMMTRVHQLFRMDVTRLHAVVGRRYADRTLWILQEPMEYEACGSAEVTGAQIRDLGHRVGHVLREHGVSTNDRVVIAKSNHPDYLLYLHSIIAIGGIPVSVNSGGGWERIQAIADRCGARFVLTDEATLPAPGEEHLRTLCRRGVTVLVVGHTAGERTAAWAADGDFRHIVGEVDRAPAVPPARRRIADDTAVAMFHTSGTTGVPKCCVWTQRNAHRVWKTMMPTLPMGPGSRPVIATPFSHAQFFAFGTGALLTGAPVYMMSRFDPVECLRTIERRRATHLIAFPYVYMRITAEDLDSFDLSSMRFWITGADKAHAAHIAKLIRHGSVRMRPGGPKGSIFVDTYGSTEIGRGGIAHMWRPGSTPEPCVQGKPMPTQFGVRIVDKQWQDLPKGTEGRILVRSTTHFEGYWNDHDTWADYRIDGWWWGGDVGRIDGHGRLIFLDREADSVDTPQGVIRTLPVEEELLGHPDVMEATVFQHTTDPRTGQGEAVAWVVPRGILTTADLGDPERWSRLEDELRARTVDLLGPDRSVARIRIVPLADVPFGVTGKVLKRNLRERVDAALPAVGSGLPSGETVAAAS